MISPVVFPKLASLALLFCFPITLAAQSAPPAVPEPDFTLQLKAERATATYVTGETITYKVTAVPKGDKAVPDLEVSWTTSKDGVAPVQTGKTKLAQGAAVVTGKLDEPGFLQCRISVEWEPGKPALTAVAGAAVDPLKIPASQPVPDDFDAFWDGEKKKLAAIPLNSKLTPVDSALKEVAAFDVQVDCVGKPVSGYFAKPVNAQPKSLPAILFVHGAGVRSSMLGTTTTWASKQSLAMDINAHGIPNGQSDQFYQELAQGELLAYTKKGSEARETCYFTGMFLREIRALDFLAAQPEWDGKTLIVYGSSQGGYQAFAAAGLDPRVTFFAAGVPAGCDHTGMLKKRIAGWPKLVPLMPDGNPDPKVLQTSRYVDAMNFATRAKAKGCIVTVGFIDTVCPPTSVYAAYNNLSIPKRMFDDIPTAHANSPAATRLMQEAVWKHIEEMKAAPSK